MEYQLTPQQSNGTVTAITNSKPIVTERENGLSIMSLNLIDENEISRIVNQALGHINYNLKKWTQTDFATNKVDGYRYEITKA